MLLLLLVIFIGASPVATNICTTSVDSGKCESICNITETSKEPSQLELELCKPSFDKDHTQLHIYFTASKYEKFTLQSVISSDIACHYGRIYVTINNSTINTISAKAIPQSVVNEQTCSVNYKTIEFNGNTFRKVETNSFSREVKLYKNKLEILGQITDYSPDNTDLNLSNANIKQVDLVFGTFPKLTILSLAGNNIETINRAFVDIPYLKELDLSSNHMKVIDVNTFAGLTKLEDLNLSDNQISSINNAFQVTKDLLSLSLSNNKLSQINFKTFSELSNLKYLDLSHNQISVLNHAFSYLTNLIKLNLSYNVIKRGDYDTYTGLSKLIFLDLSHNEIITFDEKLPINIPMVDLRYNKLDTLNTALYNDLIQMKKGSRPGGNEMRTTEKSPPLTTSTKYVPEVPFEPHSGYYKIVCYLNNWARHRKGAGKFVPEDIDANLCTHIVYGFAVLDKSDLTIKPHTMDDLESDIYEKVVAYKTKGLKVILAIGGWTDSNEDKYSRLVNSPSDRTRFITNVIEFLEKHNFDGLSMDWEYPKCWQSDCSKGPDSDKAGFGAFVRELHAAFKPKGLLLSAVVSHSKYVIDASYDVPAMIASLDWVGVKSYDYHGQWDKQTGHVAPMYGHPEDKNPFDNINYTINYWISEGMPRRKIVMGMPLYGQSFRLENKNSKGINAKASGPGDAGEFTTDAGTLAYYEICDRIKNRGWTVVKNPKMLFGPYAYNNDQWVSFDDKDMICLKSEYIRKMNLGGGMIWALDQDDFKNHCEEGRYPLLSTIRKVLGPAPTTEELAGGTGSTSEMINYNPNSEYKVVCYFTNWASYRQDDSKFLPSNIDSDLCSHIVYAFAILNEDNGTIKPQDNFADIYNKFYEKVTAYKAKGVKVLIAIGGWSDSPGDKYSKLVNNPSARKKFIAHVVDFIGMHGFDGLDLHWKYPKCWLSDCSKGPTSDKAAFAAFVKELSDAFKPKGWLLSAAVSPMSNIIDAGYDVPALSQYLDWLAVLAFDYHGKWEKVTGHVAPLYALSEDSDVTNNANASINYWIEKGADPKKLLLGMPISGASFSLANINDHGLNAQTKEGGENARSAFFYYEICQNIKQKGWTVVHDHKGRIGPYAYLGDQWVSFDDRDTIRHKSDYIKSMGLGGGIIWSLDMDDFRNLCNCETFPLLKTINRVLRNYTKPEPQCVLE